MLFLVIVTLVVALLGWWDNRRVVVRCPTCGVKVTPLCPTCGSEERH